MLRELLGGKTAERVLLYLAAMGGAHPLEIAKAFEISNTQVLRTLQKLEDADILIGHNAGRSRVYTLNKGWFAANELRRLLEKALLQIPLDEQEKYFMKRGRPRKKSKGVG